MSERKGVGEVSSHQPSRFCLTASGISGATIRHPFAPRLRRALWGTRPVAKKLTKAKPNTVFKEYFRRYCVGNPRQATACLAVSFLPRQKSFLKNCFALKTQSCVLSVLRLAFISFTLASLATAPPKRQSSLCLTPTKNTVWNLSTRYKFLLIILQPCLRFWPRSLRPFPSVSSL